MALFPPVCFPPSSSEVVPQLSALSSLLRQAIAVMAEEGQALQAEKQATIAAYQAIVADLNKIFHLT